MAVLDHNGDLTLAAVLPVQLRPQLLDRESLLAHLLQWVPSLSAITDVFVSWLLPTVDQTSRSDHGASSAGASSEVLRAPPPSLPLLPQILAWLGPLHHVVPPAAWQGDRTSHLHAHQAAEQLVEELRPDLDFSLQHSSEVERAAVRLGLYGLTQLRQLKAS